MARIVSAVPAYGHFCVEHNRGHHRFVATPADPASSRMGENIYKFACREIPGAFRRGWNAEKERLARQGKSAWHHENEILQSYALTAVLQVSLVVAFGWVMLPFLAVHNFFAWWQLTSANYIEHYGLLRRQNANGTFEHCQPYHSWNANHVASNVVLFHLERHSDHHAHPTRRYQTLRSFREPAFAAERLHGHVLHRRVPGALVSRDGQAAARAAAHQRRPVAGEHRSRAARFHRSALFHVAAPRSGGLGATIMSIHVCPDCGYAYDEALGDRREGYAPGTLFAQLPDDFVCPDCAVRAKADFIRNDQREAS